MHSCLTAEPVIGNPAPAVIPRRVTRLVARENSAHDECGSAGQLKVKDDIERPAPVRGTPKYHFGYILIAERKTICRALNRYLQISCAYFMVHIKIKTSRLKCHWRYGGSLQGKKNDRSFPV
ncbi:hypothetical protein ACJJTC_006097 [Scirpophaga incertulas]